MFDNTRFFDRIYECLNVRVGWSLDHWMYASVVGGITVHGCRLAQDDFAFSADCFGALVGRVLSPWPSHLRLEPTSDRRTATRDTYIDLRYLQLTLGDESISSISTCLSDWIVSVRVSVSEWVSGVPGRGSLEQDAGRQDGRRGTSGREQRYIVYFQVCEIIYHARCPRFIRTLDEFTGNDWVYSRLKFKRIFTVGIFIIVWKVII